MHIIIVAVSLSCITIMCSDITALPNMKEHIYATEDDACMESMITVMQITATILQSTELDESILSTGEQTFCALFSQYLEKV